MRERFELPHYKRETVAESQAISKYIVDCLGGSRSHANRVSSLLVVTRTFARWRSILHSLVQNKLLFFKSFFWERGRLAPFPLREKKKNFGCVMQDSWIYEFLLLCYESHKPDPTQIIVVLAGVATFSRESCKD